MIAELCPKCGSNKITGKKKVVVVGITNKVECVSCGWKGEDKDLFFYHVGENVSLSINDPASEIVKEAVSAFSVMLAQNTAEPIVKSLVMSGLVGAQEKEVLQELVAGSVEAMWLHIINYFKDKDKEQAGVKDEPIPANEE